MSNNKHTTSTAIHYLALGGIAFFVFAIDLNLPPEVTDRSLYAGLILVGLLACNRNLIIVGAVAGTILVVMGYLLSPIESEVWKAPTNRVISILLIWIATLICLIKQKKDTALLTTLHNLENKITERTTSLNEVNIALKKKSNYLQLHENIAKKVNENINIESIFQDCLKQICALANAQVGHLYLSENRFSSRLLPQKIWHLDNKSEFQGFKELTEHHIFDSGIGLPGRVHEIRKPVWIEHIDQDLNFPRANHEESFTIKSGFAFPIFIGEKIAGVMEFFFKKQKNCNNELLDLMGKTGVQIGRALERRFSEEDQKKILLSLKERVKELTCMSEVAKLITVSKTMDEVLCSIEKFIVPAWQFPELTQTRVSFSKKVFGAKVLPQTPWILSTKIFVNREVQGLLEVCYYDKPPNTGDCVFLDEEKNLLTWLGQILSSAASRLENARELESSNTELRSLYNKLEHVREEERTRIARELHDELGQALTICKLDLTWLKQKTLNSSCEVENKLNSMTQHIDTTLQELNRIASELRPHILNVIGLFEALKLETEKFTNLTGINGHIYISEHIPTLHPDLSTLFFRVYQETLTNVARHADATKIIAKFIKCEDFLELTVNDNGNGIETRKAYNSNSFGLTGVRERVQEWGGEFSINGAPKKGTQVSIRIPFLKALN
ncbi:MAG: GAF domain-containing sensor histidine kinase [Nitrospinae bacterium]|nr:GAF domain-containing sensor histidine kinase [Nitrospinota bacterium]